MHLSSLLQQRISALPSTDPSTIDALLRSSLRFFPSLIQRSIRETLVDMVIPHLACHSSFPTSQSIVYP
jgi:hypothetical protein